MTFRLPNFIYNKHIKQCFNGDHLKVCLHIRQEQSDRAIWCDSNLEFFSGGNSGHDIKARDTFNCRRKV